MAWPFASVGPPNLDTGPGVAVPLVSTALTAAQAWLTGAHFTNTAGTTITLTITNTAGGRLAFKDIPPGADQPFEWPFRPSLGVKWLASAAGLEGHLWGYL